ncbi:hypothetical protein [Parendozoicomonas haliclonae]|uniref:Uncharacterized protein n=1 Tax=Parendozoicomonas haliclonae TaxID=1960125 RepID=A0A1X7AND8_9GAMM|nr:hypothetical protein [Parendozoicomonas haliclonae]SMA49663.1 hypothetical protein EHSB41UT_03445 [Parendozoicomonas haliclonae]
MLTCTKTAAISLTCLLGLFSSEELEDRSTGKPDSGLVMDLADLPASEAGDGDSRKDTDRKDPDRDVVSTPELDTLAIRTLQALPPNTSFRKEHTGYIYRDAGTGELIATEAQLTRTTMNQSAATATIYIPTGKGVVAVYHDHFKNTLPGPGPGDGEPLRHGFVSYLRDAQGSLYKIEYSEAWKTEANKNNGWRLTTLRGKNLAGQQKWRPGIVFTRYEK